MKTREPTLSNRLADMAESIRKTLDASKNAERTSIRQALTAGHQLAAAKAHCHHGKWLAFLDRAGLHERKAQRLMQLAASGLNSDTVSDLGGIKAALAYLATHRLPGPGECVAVYGDQNGRERCEPLAIIGPAEFLFFRARPDAKPERAPCHHVAFFAADDWAACRGQDWHWPAVTDTTSRPVTASGVWLVLGHRAGSIGDLIFDAFPDDNGDVSGMLTVFGHSEKMRPVTCNVASENDKRTYTTKHGNGETPQAGRAA